MKAQKVYLELTPRAAMGLARLLEHIHFVGGIPPEIYGSHKTRNALQRALPDIANQLSEVIFACEDCLRLTHDEYYIVHDPVWTAAGMAEGMLCIGCLEQRLGRILTPVDFKACLANSELWGGDRSPRLHARLSGVNEPAT